MKTNSESNENTKKVSSFFPVAVNFTFFGSNIFGHRGNDQNEVNDKNQANDGNVEKNPSSKNNSLEQQKPLDSDNMEKIFLNLEGKSTKVVSNSDLDKRLSNLRDPFLAQGSR